MPIPRPKPKLKAPPLPSPKRATSASGQLFSLGDAIEIIDPLGNFVPAKITSFYRDASGEIWATFQPLAANPNSPWEMGCIRQEALKAPQPPSLSKF